MGNRNQYLASLINELSKQSGYISAGELGKRLHVTGKTIYKYVNELSTLISDNDIPIVVTRIPRLGIMLKGDGEAFDNLRQQLGEGEDALSDPRLRRLDIFVKLLTMKGGGLRLSKLAEKYYVTSASIKADLVYMNRLFAQNQIHIECDGGLVKLIGSERDIQKAAVHELIRRHGGEPLDIDYSSRGNTQSDLIRMLGADATESARAYLMTLRQVQSQLMPSHYLDSLHIVLSVLVLRTRLGHHINPEEIQTKDISYMTTYIVANDTAEYLKKYDGIQLETGDVQYLSEQFYANGLNYTVSDFSYRRDYEHVTRSMISSVSSMLKVDLFNDTQLEQSLLTHLPPMIFRLEHHIYVRNPLLTEIKKSYQLLFYMLWYAATELEEKYNIILNDDEIGFLVIYFETALEKNHNVRFRSIAVVCPHGLLTSELIYEKLRRVTPINYKLEITDREEVANLNPEDFELVVSPVRVPETRVPVIRVSPVLSDEDVTRILTFCNVQTKHNYASMKSTYNSLDVRQYFDSSLMFLNRHFDNKRDCLDFLIKTCEQRGETTGEFGTSVYARDELSDTSLPIGIAIPHGAPDTIRQTRIVVMTLDHVIAWGVNRIDTVFFFAIAKKDVSSIHGFVRNFFRLIQTDGFKAQLRASSTPVEVVNLFIRLTNKN